MASYEFDLLIAGAGPAGCTLALNLAPLGIRIGIIEKDVFPRHKICGDALGGKVINVMKRIPGNVYGDFMEQVTKIPSWGIRFVAPNSHEVDVPFLQKHNAGQTAPGYVCRRYDFDAFMAGKLAGHPNISLFQGERIERVFTRRDHITAVSRSHEFRGMIMAGADGVHSVIRTTFLQPRETPGDLCIGIRGYFENVAGLHPENFIEMIFLKRLLPGYFWIFPSTGGMVNAGLGMLKNKVTRNRENLVHVLNDLVSSDPILASRFANARLMGKPEAQTLPLGTYRFKRSGDRFLLLGDAAFLVDPFSGEGIGNAMASGETAAAVLGPLFAGNDFSAEKLQAYDERIRKRFSQEFRIMGVIQRLAGSARLFNLVVDKAGKNEDIRNLLTSMFTSERDREKLTRPGFYARLLFR